MLKRAFFIAAGVAMLCSCEDDPNRNNNDGDLDSFIESKEVVFTSSINDQSRVSSNVFESGDEIYVTALEDSASFATKVAYSYNGSIFTSNDPIVYSSESQQLSFRAVYPAVSNYAESFSFTILADQSSGDNYEMSDLLTASVAATSSVCPDLQFNHKMSNIIINITSSGKSGGVMEVEAKNAVSCNVVDDSYVASGSAVTITPAASGSAGYTMLVAPQTISAGEIFATYVVDAITYTWTLDANTTFLSGYKYTYNWNLVDREVTLDSVINDWGDGGTQTIDGE